MFFRKKNQPSAPAPTAIAPRDRDERSDDDDDGATCSFAPFVIAASVQTDKGCVRDGNEDAGRHTQPNDPALLARKGTLTIVCDGMGGHLGGEVASNLAIEIISRAYYGSDAAPAAALRAALVEANAAIYEAAEKDEALKGMGTTCTAMVLRGGQAICAHVGDSRLYMLRGGELYQLTEDHSAVMEMVKHGIISREEARHHEDKNVILRALGTSPAVEPTLWDEPLELRAGDRFLLCSDGLYDLVEDDELRDAMTNAADDHAAGERLIELAKERGGHDNITVIIVAVASHDAANLAAATVTAPQTRETEVLA